MIWPDGSVYDGDWDCGIASGHGTLSTSKKCKSAKCDDGVSVSGLWSNGYNDDMEEALITKKTNLENALAYHEIANNLVVPFRQYSCLNQSLPIKGKDNKKFFV